MSNIHPTAVIEPGAEIAQDAIIGPLCYVGAKAKVGARTRLVAHVAVLGRTTLGQDNTVWPQTTLGADPQDLKFKGEDTELIIGDSNDIRESVTMHLGTANGGGVTRVGSNNLIMVNSHIAHDCIIGSHVVIANLVQLAGHIVVADHAVIAGASAVHHYVTIGQYAMVGGMTRVVHDVPPFMITEGNPAKVRGVNKLLLTRHRFPEPSIESLREAYKLLYRKESNGDVTSNMSENLDRLMERYPHEEVIESLVGFIRKTSIGLHGRYRENERPDKPNRNPVR